MYSKFDHIFAPITAKLGEIVLLSSLYNCFNLDAITHR